MTIKNAVFVTVAILALMVSVNARLDVAECPETQVVVSDASTQVDAHDSVVINPSPWTPPWTTGISGADWIWYQDESLNNPLVTETKTFTKTFSLNWPVDSASLKITADNGFRVYINGNLVDDATYVSTIGGTDGQYFKNVYTYDIKSKLVPGTNTITVDGVNLGVAGTTPLSNPGAIIYRIDVDNDCEPTQPLPEFGSKAALLAVLVLAPAAAFVYVRRRN